jgi:hypothetical protein
VQVSGEHESEDSVAVERRKPPQLHFASYLRSPFADPFEQRITSPLTVASDLHKRRVAQRSALDY